MARAEDMGRDRVRRVFGAGILWVCTGLDLLPWWDRETRKWCWPGCVGCLVGVSEIGWKVYGD